MARPKPVPNVKTRESFKVTDADIAGWMPTITNGLLAPDGEIFVCGYGEHSYLANAIAANKRVALLPECDSQDTLLKLKWVKLQDCRWSGGPQCLNLTKHNHEWLSQKQRDFIFDWSETHKKTVPWVEEESVAPCGWA